MYLSIPAYHDRAYLDPMRCSCVVFFCPYFQWPYPTQILPYMVQDDTLYVLSWLILQIAARQLLTVSSPQMQLPKGHLVLQKFPWSVGKDLICISLSPSLAFKFFLFL